MKKMQEEKPPLLGSWKTWYVMVIAFLVVLIILFKMFTNYFA